MFVKNILKAFERDTKIEAYIFNEHLKIFTPLDYGTVGEFIDSGLMTYATIDEDSLLEIEDDKILIFMR
jgi:hypothetical protein